MSLTGKGNLSIKKKDVREQKSIAIGFKSLMFGHKATLGDSGINLNALVTPTEMASSGFVNPTVADLQTARLMFFRKNLRLVSSLKGELMDYLSYEVASSTQINFKDFTAEDGEIFIGVVEVKPITAPIVVEARPIAVTGELAVSVTDFNVGTPFEINKFDSEQVGAVLVFRNGQLQARNTGNSSIILDANYREVDAGTGLGTIIRFNNAPVGQSDNIMVVSNGLLAERPTGSMMAEIENIAGQLDQVIPTVAALSGQPESNFQSAPNSVDLKQFGDQVIDHEVRLDKLEEGSMIRVDTSNGYGSSATRIKRFSNIRESIGNGISYVDSATNGSSFTAVVRGIYSISYADGSNTAGFSVGLSKNASSLTTSIASISGAERLLYWNPRNSDEVQAGSWTGILEAGDIIRPHTDGGVNPSNTERVSFTMTLVKRLP